MVKLKKELDDGKKYEEIKKNLETDERTIHQKLDAIDTLVSDRARPPKLVLALSSTVPKLVWLSELKVEAQDVVLRGNALDFNQVSEFLKSLNENAFFKDTKLVTTQQGTDESGMETAKFEISVHLRDGK